jgi:hypothetical protein
MEFLLSLPEVLWPEASARARFKDGSGGLRPPLAGASMEMIGRMGEKKRAASATGYR